VSSIPVVANLGVRLRPGRPNETSPEKGLPAVQPSNSTYDQALADRHNMPDYAAAIELLSRFFDTVGAVLPFVSERTLLGQLENLYSQLAQEQKPPCDHEALINIVFAHALSTVDGASPGPFYQRSLSLAEAATLCAASLESRAFVQHSRSIAIRLTRDSPVTASPGQISAKY
jgi:hypothetical protein